MLENIRIVLVHTTHPGNIGAVARAMKTMCLTNLFLVQPKVFPDPEATARAKQAGDILNNAVVVNTLVDAIGDCCFVVGASARQRYLNWPLLDINQMGNVILQEAAKHKVALVFGSERTGLTNEEIALCHYQINIPANPAYSSLNLAAAVQIVAYEIYKNYIMQTPIIGDDKPSVELATQADMLGFYQHLEQVLGQVGYKKSSQINSILSRLRRLYNRSHLEKIEINILRGILTAVQKKQSMDEI